MEPHCAVFAAVAAASIPLRPNPHPPTSLVGAAACVQAVAALVHQLWDMLPGLSDPGMASAATAPAMTLLSRLVASPAAAPPTSQPPSIKPEPGSDACMEDKAAQQAQAIGDAVMAERVPRLFPFLRHPPSGVRLSALQVGKGGA